MTWEILAAIITIVLAGISVGKLIYELSKTLTKLNCSVEMLNSSLSTLTCENRRDHEELFGAVQELYDNYRELMYNAEKKQ